MSRRLSRLLFLVALAWGCSARLASDEVAPPPGGQIPVSGKDAVSDFSCRKDLTLVPTPHPVEVLILLDRSGSMALAQGSTSRFEAARDALTALVTGYARTVRFGLVAFPTANACGAGVAEGCCVVPPPVTMRPPDEVVSSLAAATPAGGNTPTAMVLELARRHFATQADTFMERFALLVTDGDPSCTLAGSLGPAVPGAAGLSPACADALESMRFLVAAGVQVPVIALGQEPGSGFASDAECLDQLSHAGAGAASPGTPGFYRLDQMAAIRSLLVRAIGNGDVPSCLVRVGGPSSRSPELRVELDGEPLVLDGPDGWAPDSSDAGMTVRLKGAACAAAMELRALTVSVIYPSKTCVDGTPS